MFLSTQLQRVKIQCELIGSMERSSIHSYQSRRSSCPKSQTWFLINSRNYVFCILKLYALCRFVWEVNIKLHSDCPWSGKAIKGINGYLVLFHSCRILFCVKRKESCKIEFSLSNVCSFRTWSIQTCLSSVVTIAGLSQTCVHFLLKKTTCGLGKAWTYTRPAVVGITSHYATLTVLCCSTAVLTDVHVTSAGGLGVL